ncbi:glycosyltransferase family 2 protein [Aureimonas sp. AU12]|uniref:glycosyltransferase family 2 protein n=1 Tax=Aureimonas sp. AU12 TaxID=1638161 RepID=UPI0007838EC0|nr:glycosyltransferase family 2 protein [Aureimonas sp. AU12]
MRTEYRADLVIPCFHEEDALPETAPVILAYMRGCVEDPTNGLTGFRILFVDDGSRDRTWPIIAALAAENTEAEGVKLSRNFGHQGALLAGLAHADADVVISLDADLQDDIAVIRDMLRAYEAGNDLALGVRSDRRSDRWAKRETARLYYRILSALGVRIVPDHADFRLMSRRALKALLAYDEANLFLRGIIPLIGFPVALVPYARLARTAGETKYTMRKMLRLAIDGITSFSVVPLRAISVLGLIVFGLSVAAGLYVVLQRFLLPSSVVPGWASTLLPLLLLGGIQILSVGVIGEYLGKIYLETKRRPRFTVERLTDVSRDH